MLPAWKIKESKEYQANSLVCVFFYSYALHDHTQFLCRMEKFIQ